MFHKYNHYSRISILQVLHFWVLISVRKLGLMATHIWQSNLSKNSLNLLRYMLILKQYCCLKQLETFTEKWLNLSNQAQDCNNLQTFISYQSLNLYRKELYIYLLHIERTRQISWFKITQNYILVCTYPPQICYWPPIILIISLYCLNLYYVKPPG